ncbi:MAG TPA: type II secretion system protein [Planctomycetota bacterium]|nr:type II secretion system protein [Planctomycetota bacterium]
MSPARAFTLIEMIVSIGIGAVICTAAFVAVRVSAQTIQTADRLSLENGLMRAGVAQALDELDFWTGYDDPAPGSANRTLRQAGEPFARFDFTIPEVTLDLLPDRQPLAYEEWCAQDARTWYRGDPACGDGVRAANYSLISRAGFPDISPTGDAHRRWQHHFVRDVNDGLGYFALIDYAPANLLYASMDENGYVTDEYTSFSGGGPGPMLSPAVYEDRAHDFFALTSGTLYPILLPDKLSTPPYAGADANACLFVDYAAAGVNPGWSTEDYWNRWADRLRPIPLRPRHWPELQVIARHYAANARQWHTATVLLRSPVSGQTFKVFFSHTSTTLRGARRQRAQTDGWARPGDPTLDDG